MQEEIQNRIYLFFINSSDFNGIPLRQISDEIEVSYEESIDLIKKLVKDEIVSIQSSTNPHIIGFQHFPIESQLEILEQAKDIKVTTQKFGDFIIASEDTEFPICLYPSQEILTKRRDLSDYGNAVYSKQLALGEPQLKPIFFEIEVLERYAKDPRFEFKFEDYSGSIYCKYDESGNPIVREEDIVFLKTFGLGFDDKGNRLAVVYLRYLKGLTNEHQVYWKSKEANRNCHVLKEYHENSIQGNWTFSFSIFSAFIGELNCLNELSNVAFGKKVFRKSFEGDNRPKEFTFFFTPTLRNYNEFVLLLDKMVSDNINKDFFKDELELYDIQEIEEGVIERRQKGTLRLFQEWLSSKYKTEQQDDIKEIFKPLKRIRRERQNPAHKIDENEYHKKYIEKQRELIKDAYFSMKTLRRIFQQHRKSVGVTIPDWLENGEIKIF